MRKELALWLFFLMACLGAGYLKGNSAADAGTSFFGGPAEVEILLSSDLLMPLTIRQELERKLNIQIKVLVVHDREEFNIRSITSPGYHLALVPDHWIGPANMAHQMSNLNPLKDFLSERISADFLQTSQAKIYGAPIFWMVTHLYESAHEPATKASANLGKIFYFLNDWDYFTTKASELNISSRQLRPLEFFKTLPNFDSMESVFEISHLDEDEKNKLSPSNYDFTSLYVWSFCTPRHSPSRKITLKLIEALTDADLQIKWVRSLPLASTLKTLDDLSFPRKKKAIYVRDLDLSHLRKAKSLSLEELKQVKIDQSTH